GEGLIMEFRPLGGSGLKVPALSLGTGTFGGKGELFKAWGGSGVAEAKRLIDICLEAGLNMFDTADVYSDGLSEEILGEALKGRRPGHHFHQGDVPHGAGAERPRLLALTTCCTRARRACSASAPTTSTSITCTASTRPRRSRKRCARSTISSPPARCATSRARISPAGI